MSKLSLNYRRWFFFFKPRQFPGLAYTLSLLFGLSSVFPSHVFAQTQAWSQGVCLYKDTDVATIQGLQCLIANIFRVAVAGIGLVGFVMIIYGGFMYLVSGTNSKGVESARKSITYAIIGLVVALSSFFIINIIAQFTGIQSILQFSLPGPDTNLPTQAEETRTQ